MILASELHTRISVSISMEKIDLIVKDFRFCALKYILRSTHTRSANIYTSDNDQQRQGAKSLTFSLQLQNIEI